VSLGWKILVTVVVVGVLIYLTFRIVAGHRLHRRADELHSQQRRRPLQAQDDDTDDEADDGT
jgi:Mg2+/citrate symporter